MTVKEAALKSLDNLRRLASHNDVYEDLTANGYYTFTTNKTPTNYVSAVLGGFIRSKDKRVKRIYDRPNNRYLYYLTKYEDELDLSTLDELEIENSNAPAPVTKVSYQERDLHLLLSTYLNNGSVYAKTIFHERSNSSDNNRKWVHPDMVGVRMLKLQSPNGRALLRATNKNDLFKLHSYKLKKSISSDYDLKKYYFQAVSNSSWANYGYLVAHEISDQLHEEIERLNQSFGIGVIALAANPFESEVLYPARYRPIDYKTVDKLCKINPDFDRFIETVEKTLSATDRYAAAMLRELGEVCDDYLEGDRAVTTYLEKIGLGEVAEASEQHP